MKKTQDVLEVFYDDNDSVTIVFGTEEGKVTIRVSRDKAQELIESLQGILEEEDYDY